MWMSGLFCIWSTKKMLFDIIITLLLKNGLLSVDEVFAKTSSKMNTYIYTFTEDVGGYKLYQIERK